MKMTASIGTTATTTSPLRRSLVWSHNTSYPGATGIHSEVGKTAQAQQATEQRQLNSNLSTIQSIHRKELRSLSQNRKSMETSMLAYTQKMRKISSNRLLLAGGTGMAESPTSKNPSSEAEQEMSTGALERLLALNKDRDEFVPSSSLEAKKNARDSMDSGIDLTEAGTEKKVSDERLFDVVRRSPPELPAPNPKRRPASFHTIDSSAANFTTTMLPSADRHNKAASGPSSLDSRSRQRQRRPGTAEKPDLASLQLSNRAEAEEQTRKDSSPAAEDTSLAITPFPEFQSSPLSPFTSRGDRTGLIPSPEEKPSRRKSLKARGEDYWSYRRAPQRRSISVASSVASPRRSSQDSRDPQRSPPRQIAPRPARPPKPSRPPPKKTYHLPFRYSDAVDNVMRSFDDRLTGTAIRRVSETLPALSIHDLHLERSRWIDEPVRRGRPSQGRSRPNHDEDFEFSDAVDVLPRERSMSAPVDFDSGRREGYTIEEEEEGEEGEEEGGEREEREEDEEEERMKKEEEKEE